MVLFEIDKHPFAINISLFNETHDLFLRPPTSCQTPVENRNAMLCRVKDANYLIHAFNVEPTAPDRHVSGSIPEYCNWQMPTTRRFRSLKLWLMLRIYGVQGMQDHVRGQIALARHFEALMRKDKRFEIVTEVSMGVVCFRLKV